MTFASQLATWFGAGKLRPAPGTWGSLAALLPGALLMWAGGPWLLLLGSLVVFAVGLRASQVHATTLGKSDPGEIVIDEVAGQWLTLVPLAFDWRLWVIGFVAFRLFDIVKPWPVSWFDRSLSGGLGIMADDMAAGLLAALVTALLGWWIWSLPCWPFI